MDAMKAGQQCFDLEVVAVENLRGEDGPAERRSEDRPDTRANAARDRDAGVFGTEIKSSSEQAIQNPR